SNCCQRVRCASANGIGAPETASPACASGVNCLPESAYQPSCSASWMSIEPSGAAASAGPSTSLGMNDASSGSFVYGLIHTVATPNCTGSSSIAAASASAAPAGAPSVMAATQLLLSSTGMSVSTPARNSSVQTIRRLIGPMAVVCSSKSTPATPSAPGP